MGEDEQYKSTVQLVQRESLSGVGWGHTWTAPQHAE